MSKRRRLRFGLELLLVTVTFGLRQGRWQPKGIYLSKVRRQPGTADSTVMTS